MKPIKARDWRQPRLWLVGWIALGVLGLVYVIVASSVQTGGRPGAGPSAPAKRAQDPALLVGEMASFAYAFPPRGAPIAPFELDGKAITLGDFRGKVILVNFWATWCAPCLEELPSLEALQVKLGGPGFEVVAIAADPKGPLVAGVFLDRLGLTTLKRYADPTLRLAASLGGPASLPISILYDARGNEIGRLVGKANWASPEAEALVRHAIQR